MSRKRRGFVTFSSRKQQFLRVVRSFFACFHRSPLRAYGARIFLFFCRESSFKR
jgi:hypothetical protein